MTKFKALIFIVGIILIGYFAVFKDLINKEPVLIINVEVPSHTPKNATLTLGGSFNHWQPTNDEYVLTKHDKNHYQFVLRKVEIGQTISFKVTRGSWDTVQIAKDGSNIGNNDYVIKPGRQTLNLSVQQWADLNTKKPPSTVLGNVIIEDIDIPTFALKRKIRIYLPPEHDSSTNTYPVIYMTDGQNVFDKALSNAGEWQMDELMEKMHIAGSPLTSIIVAIDHAGKDRQAEYDPWDYYDQNVLIKGKGDEFADFLALTIKPSIDARFKTKPQAKHTMIMGSSMGGLIALYIGVKHSKTFGRTAGLSSALLDDLIGDNFVDYIKLKKSNPHSLFYFDIGDQEVELMTESIFDDSQAVYNALQKIGYTKSQLNYQVIKGGVHNEKSWSNRTLDIIEWLYTTRITH